MATQIPGRTTDLREVNLSRQLQGSGKPAVQAMTAPQVQPIQPVQAQATQQAQDPNVLTSAANPAQVPSGQTAPQLITDPNTLQSAITPENTLRTQRLGFGVEAGNVAAPGEAQQVNPDGTVQSVQDAFAAQLPQLQQQLRDEIEGLSKSTSALGRTGIGIFDKDAGVLGERNASARESLLGNLLFQATQSDASRALSAAQGNQATDLSQKNLAANIAQSNADRALDVDFARQSHLANLQAREDTLGRQAAGDEALRLQLLQQGFAGAPTGAIGNAANVLTGGSAQFGDNASVLGNQVGGLTEQAIQAILRGQGQGAVQ